MHSLRLTPSHPRPHPLHRQVWTLPDVSQHVQLKHLHAERTLVSHRLGDNMMGGRYGVSELVVEDGWMFSAGADGVVKATPLLW